MCITLHLIPLETVTLSDLLADSIICIIHLYPVLLVYGIIYLSLLSCLYLFTVLKNCYNIICLLRGPCLHHAISCGLCNCNCFNYTKLYKIKKIKKKIIATGNFLKLLLIDCTCTVKKMGCTSKHPWVSLSSSNFWKCGSTSRVKSGFSLYNTSLKSVHFLHSI